MTTAEDCNYCEDGVCVGCSGTGKHPYAGAGSPLNRDYVSVNEKCPWCEGTGRCSSDETHTKNPPTFNGLQKLLP